MFPGRCRPRLFAGDLTVCARAMNLPWSRSHVAPSATSAQRLRCVTYNDVFNGSPELAMPSTQPLTALTPAVTAQPHGAAAVLADEIGSVPEAPHREIAFAACSGRVRGQNPRSDARIALLCDSGCSDRNTCDFVSHVHETFMKERSSLMNVQ